MSDYRLQSLAQALEDRNNRRPQNNSNDEVNQESKNREARHKWEATLKSRGNAYLLTPAGKLYTATINGNVAEMESIMAQHKLSPDVLVTIGNENMNQYPILAYAVMKGQTEAAEFLMDKGANVNILLQKNDYSIYSTILLYAFESDTMRIVNKILSKPTTPDFINRHHYQDVYNPHAEWMVQVSSTALTLAINKSNIELVQRLIQLGADVTLEIRILDRDGELKEKTPIEIALEEKKYEIATILRQAGAARPSLYKIRHYVNINTLNWVFQNYPRDFGLPPDYSKTLGIREILFTLSNLRDPDVIRDFFMIDYSSVINEVNSDGNTILMVAVLNNNLWLVKYALRDGAKTAIQRADGNTALHLAAISASTKTGADKVDAVAIVDFLLTKNPILTKIKNKQGYLARDPRLGVTKDISDLIYSKTPWFAKNANKKGGSRKTRRTRRIR